MNVEITKNEKQNLELKMDNLTIAEIIRVYLYENGASFAAWKREHPSKPLIMNIQSSDKNIKKVVSDAIAAIKKDTGAILSAVKK